jgi:hypothetical protein
MLNDLLMTNDALDRHQLIATFAPTDYYVCALALHTFHTRPTRHDAMTDAFFRVASDNFDAFVFHTYNGGS